MIAVIACAPDMTVSRAKLQDLFWGSSDEKHASGSLRAAIFQLRTEFELIIPGSIEVHKNHVTLSQRFWRMEPLTNPEVFMEGFDVRLKGADQFEEWLRLQRQSSMSAQEIDSERFESGIVSEKSCNHIAIGLLPTEFHFPPQTAQDECGALLDLLVFTLRQFSLAAIYDLRGTVLDSGELQNSPENNCGYLLRSIAYKSRRILNLRVVLVEARTGKVVHSFEPIDVRSDIAEHVLMNVAELALDALLAIGNRVPPANLMPWAALSSLFSLDSQAIMATESEIDRLVAEEGVTILKCLKIFLQIFKENEGMTARCDYEAPELIDALEAISPSDPLRALCESLIGYSAHMLCANNELGSFLLETAARRSPNLALNLDHLAVMQLAQGDLTSAARTHERCMSVGSLSSWRYSYDVTGAMIAMARGDYQTALRRSNQSLMQRPRFVGALRYAMIGFAMNNGEENARLMRRRINRLRRDYDLSSWVEKFLRRTDPSFGNNVAITLHNYELV